MPKGYPVAVRDFVREHVEGISNRDLAKLVNQEFGTDFTEESMKSYIGNHKLYRKNRRGYRKIRSKLFPEEVAVFILENYKGIGPKQMAAVLNEKFGSSYTREQVKTYYNNHDLNSGLTGYYEKGNTPWTKGKKWDEYMSPEKQQRSRETTFKKGDIPHNKMPIGTMTKTEDGITLIKVSEDGGQWDRWMPIHRKVWEDHHGPIPEGMMVIYKDGNKDNWEIDNLMLITNGENAQLNTRGLRFGDPEKTEAGLLIAKMYQAARKRRQE